MRLICRGCFCKAAYMVILSSSNFLLLYLPVRTIFFLPLLMFLFCLFSIYVAFCWLVFTYLWCTCVSLCLYISMTHKCVYVCVCVCVCNSIFQGWELSWGHLLSAFKLYVVHLHKAGAWAEHTSDKKREKVNPHFSYSLSSALQTNLLT